MTTLIVARHGNTFDVHDIPRRIGVRTDLPLVEKGRTQARAIGRYLREKNLIPDVVYTSNLERTQESAKLALEEAKIRLPLYPLQIFDEIDYGVDENKTEEDVIARIGSQALKDWEDRAIVPEGWNAHPESIINDWKNFANHIIQKHDTLTGDVMEISEIVLVLTSNGIARFAPYITENFDDFAQNYTIKLATGTLGILEFLDNQWHVKDWGIKPI